MSSPNVMAILCPNLNVLTIIIYLKCFVVVYVQQAPERDQSMSCSHNDMTYCPSNLVYNYYRKLGTV